MINNYDKIVGYKFFIKNKRVHGLRKKEKKGSPILYHSTAENKIS